MTSATPLPLAGRCIWLTRPTAQAAPLATELSQLGARTVSLPLLDIKPITPTPADRQKLIDLDQYDLVFFVSTNAAQIGLDLIGDWWPQYPAHICNFAVGPSTAAVLERQGLHVSYPDERMTSEAMLALPGLQDIAGKKALIVRGVGGREIMAEALQSRGARVDYAELYERARPAYDAAWLRERLAHDRPDGVVLSSGEAMENLKELFAPLGCAWSTLPLFVSSERLQQHAQELGFDGSFLLAGANDAAIITGLSAVFDETLHE